MNYLILRKYVFHSILYKRMKHQPRMIQYIKRTVVVSNLFSLLF